MTDKVKLAIIEAHIKVARDKGTSIQDAMENGIRYIKGEEEREKDEI